MKKCPFCGADIEDSARFCLYCMQPLTEKEQILPYKRKKPQWLLIIAAIVAVIGMCCLLTIILSDRKTEPVDGTASEGQNLTPSLDPTEYGTPPSNLPPTTPTTQPATQIATQPATQSHIHSYTVENVAAKYLVAEATCTHPATYYYSCACGEKGSSTFYWGQEAGHTIVVDSGYPADCVTTGLTDGAHCSDCNAIFLVQTQVPVVGHTFDTDQDSTCNVCNYVRVLNCSHKETIKLSAVSPTCTAGGLTEGRKCTLCEEILITQNALAPKGHTEVTDPAVPATCTTDGKTEGTHCALCQIVLVYQQHLPAKGHSFDPGIPLSPCTVCGAQQPHTHNYSEENTAIEYQKSEASCSSPAVYYYSCLCGAAGDETFTYGKKKEHTVATKPGYPPTCDMPGLTDVRYCTTCQEALTLQQQIKPLGHTYTLGDASSTCLTCGEKGAFVVMGPVIPCVIRATLRLNSCTYTVHSVIQETWFVDFHLNYTNITSESTTMHAFASVVLGDTGVKIGCYASDYSRRLEPNESSDCRISGQLPNSETMFFLDLFAG